LSLDVSAGSGRSGKTFCGPLPTVVAHAMMLGGGCSDFGKLPGRETIPRRRRKPDMQRSITLGIGLILAFAVVGCDANYKKHEALAKELIAVCNDLGDALESIKDPASAKVAAAKIDSICDRFKDIRDRVEGLPKLSKSDNDKLEKNLKADLDKAMSRILTAGPQARQKAGGNVEFENSLRRFQSIATSFGGLGK